MQLQYQPEQGLDGLQGKDKWKNNIKCNNDLLRIA